MNVEELDVFKYLETVKRNREQYHPTKDERTCAESHLVCCSKFELVLKTINSNPFNTSKFGWIDSNVGPNFSKICTNYKNNMLLNVMHNCKPDIFNLQILNVCDEKFVYPEHLREYYSRYRWVVCGSFFVTNRDVGITILNELIRVFENHTQLGYGHAEEMFYLEVIHRFYSYFSFSYGDYKHTLNNFIKITQGLEYILTITNHYLARKYYVQCMRCCSKVIESFDTFEIEQNDEMYFKFMFNLCVSNFYISKPYAKIIADKIKHFITVSKTAKQVYMASQRFYDTQLNFIL